MGSIIKPTVAQSAASCPRIEMGSNVFSRRPNQHTAAKFHSARSQAFTAWAEVTDVAMAA
jgi:hypothetical protein